LLDEIEKAHPDLLTLLLQIMDSATLTDNNGDKIDFQNVIIIMTSNLGASEASVVGFAKDDNLNENRAINNFFAPEFRNRLDEVVKFNSLGEDIIIKIVTKFIKNINDSIKDKDIKGELVCIADCKKGENSNENILEDINILKDINLSTKDIATFISKKYNISKNTIYNILKKD